MPSLKCTVYERTTLMHDEDLFPEDTALAPAQPKTGGIPCGRLMHCIFQLMQLAIQV